MIANTRRRIPLICQRCNKDFKGTCKTQRFCSLTCSNARFKNAERKCHNCDSVILGTGERYCNLFCYKEHIHRTIALPAIAAGRISDRRVLRNHIIRLRGHQCEICKITKWTGDPTPLELDHIDGDAANNKLTNLRMICPNCHAKQPTSKGKNRGNGRGAKGLSLS